jgi:glutathione S-transferase
VILYFAPGACSLADHIALHEGGLRFDRVKVDLKTHTTEDGGDYTLINPKGYVPALALDDGNVLTENIAILSWIADQAPGLAPDGPFARYRLLETLAFISTEIHKAFKPFFSAEAGEPEKAKARDAIAGRLELIAGQLEGDFLFANAFSIADAYLYVMLTWAKKVGITIADPLNAYFDLITRRPAVQLALRHEGLA